VETEEVIDLMEKTNADLVIYGEVRVIDDEAVIIPEFYVTEDFQFDVLSGRHEVELPVQFEVSDLVDPESSVNARLPQKFAILTEFTKGLVYFAAEKLDLSTEAMEKAVDYMEEYGEFKGGEVIYLLASNNARLQEEFDRSQTLLDEAFLMNPNYGRGYIAQGNIYYDQENLYQAALTYQQALTLEDQNKDAYIVEKASLNLGNIYVYQYQETVLNPDALETEKNELAQLALDSYQVVIDAYNRQDKKDRRLKGLTAWAYYGTGIVHQVKGQYDQAAQALEQALDLTTESDLIERATRRLNEVTQE
jgi:tetratricopeptide (TPR) repeat protein